MYANVYLYNRPPNGSRISIFSIFWELLYIVKKTFFVCQVTIRYKLLQLETKAIALALSLLMIVFYSDENEAKIMDTSQEYGSF
jgi:glucan phosphoethanolaminetransferase (alkaline phosphatase superfamily)